MKKTLFLGLFLACSAPNFAQNGEDLLSLLGEETTTDYATASFKTSRVINGHSIENPGVGVLDFKISHRFAPLREGFYNVVGLDNAEIKLSFDYGISERLAIGIGRSTVNKTLDGFAKYKVLRQQKGKRNVPLTLIYLADIQVETVKFPDPPCDAPECQYYFSDRLFYTHQMLLGRKFSNNFSFQLMPTIVHRNLTPSPEDKNFVFSMGAAGGLKLTKRLAVNAEYFFVPSGQIASNYENSLSLGFDIETGGHVFQLHFTNSQAMTHKAFITETAEPWFWKNDDGGLMSGLRFGFNVSRVFTVRKSR